MKIIYFFMISMIVTGCCTSEMVFQSSVVSMSKANAGSPLKEGEAVEAQFCVGDKPVVSTGEDHDLGLMDQAIYKAEKKAGTPFILNPKFYQKCNCMVIKGIAGLEEGGSHPSSNAPAKAPGTKKVIKKKS